MLRARILGLLLALAGGVACAGPRAAPQEGAAVIGQFAPTLQLEWLDGSAPGGLESLRGRVVLLEFWRTWCSPCRQQVRKLNELHERHEADGLLTIGVSNEPADLLRSSGAELGVTYALARTEGMEAETLYGIRSVPRAFLIDRAGVLVWAGHPATLESERLRSLLAQR
jgi:cytochrome c biogenesis protein CcmG/thiol:disulfide interchange protein DsbE